MKQNLDPKLLVIILFGALIVISTAFIAFNVVGIVADEAVLAEKQATLDQVVWRRDYLLGLAANANMVESKAAEFGSMLPEAIKQDDIFVAVNRLSQKYNVSVKSVTFDTKPAEAGVQANRMGFTLSLEGGFDNIMKMLEETIGNDKMIQVENIVLNSSSDNKGIITARTTVAAYYR